MGEEKFYNAKIKEEYLATISYPATRQMASYVFKKAKKTELSYKKDIYEMNLDELKDVIKGLKASTIDSAYNYLFKLQYYIDWAAKYRSTRLNELAGITDKREWVSNCVFSFRQPVYKREEILEMCKQLDNYPDRAVLLALFEGIGGEGYSELLNLRSKDLTEKDGRYYATLYNKLGEPRTIEISEKLDEYLRRTDDETVYRNKNGKSDSLRSSESLLVPSPFIFKKAARGKQDGALDLFFVQRKFTMFKELFETSYITPKRIINSGMLHHVNEIHQKQGFMTHDDWVAIAEIFNTSIIKYNGEDVRNILTLKKKASEKKFKEVYGYEVIEQEIKRKQSQRV